jgi:hypothetical protein
MIELNEYMKLFFDEYCFLSGEESTLPWFFYILQAYILPSFLPRTLMMCPKAPVPIFYMKSYYYWISSSTPFIIILIKIYMNFNIDQISYEGLHHKYLFVIL